MIETPKPPEHLYTKTTRENDGLIRAGQRRNGVFRGSGQKVQDWREKNPSETIGFTDCGCNAGWRAGVVLDCFLGSGTTALVARKHRRNWIGIELSEAYIKIAEKRLAQQSLFEKAY